MGQASLVGQSSSVFEKSVKLASHHGIAMDAQDCTRWKAICSAGLNQHMMAPPSDKPLYVPPAVTLFKGKICQGILVPPPVLVDDKGTCDHILWTVSSQDGWLQVHVCMYVCMYVCM